MKIYNELSNDPYERRRITYPYTWWNDAFSEEQLNEIEKICENLTLNVADIINDEEVIDESIRTSKIKFFQKDESTSWIFDSLNFVASTLNERFYNFNLNGYKDLQYTVYDSKNKGHYDWHMDTIMGKSLGQMESGDTRKLTLIMLLNKPGVDFTGGEFQINVSSEDKPLTVDFVRGRIIIMPSFMLHRVTPVITGIRKSIVTWIEGPKFI